MNLAAAVSRMGVWPPDACLQGLASNHPMLLWPKIVVVSDGEKADLIRQVSDGKRLPQSIVNDCNERMIRHGLNIIRSAESEDDENDKSDSAVPSSDQPAQAGSNKASSNQCTLLIDATCVPAGRVMPKDQ